jgi:hypothetical protein
MNPELTKAALSESRRQLVELMQQVNFGRIEGLVIRNRAPVLDPLPRIIHEVKFGGENAARPEREAADFILKTQVVELFEQFDRLDGGTIEVLEIKHGLPFRMLIAEAAA